MNTTLMQVQELLSEGTGEKKKLYSLCESPSLRLHKFVRLGENTKKGEIDAVVACQRGHTAGSIPPFTPRGGIQFTAKLEARLIVDHAGGILENAGICLHRHFGEPYIPGSAVKGVARHAAWCEWNEMPEGKEKKKCAENIASVFGYPTNDKSLDDYLVRQNNEKFANNAYAGAVSFLPGVPASGKGELVTDIVNCHHPDYYGRRQNDAIDNESPNPQFFPAVDQGISFRFTICPLRTASSRVAEILGLAKGWLIKGITENGAGAKTSAGYGWFSYDPEEETRQRQADAEVAAKRKQAEDDKAAEDKRIEEKHALEQMRSSMTSEERADLDVSKLNADALRQRILTFDNAKNGPSPEIMGAIVRALRGPRLSEWNDFKTKAAKKKGEYARAENSIRVFCKNDMNLGKMP